jgi:aldehyde:ferredoxin oxidoreductase
MLQLIDETEMLGMDIMTAGVVLAWATEALERGLITTAETDGLALNWGDGPTYTQAVKRLVSQPNDFYAALAHGVDHAAALYGGEEFALAFGKNEMPGYHTGPGSHLGYSTGARHSHLDSAGYSLDQKAAATGATLDPQAVALSLLEEERWRQVLTSLPICLFARGLYTPEMVVQTLKTIGIEWTEADLDRLGAETLRLKHAYKQREGFVFDKLRLPKRIFETPAPAGPFDEAFMREAIRHYAENL